jgi:UDP-N-acetylmuramoyl-tripeptide--D-alanyl-D-alanine ligase
VSEDAGVNRPDGEQSDGPQNHPWSLGAIARMTGATIAGISPEDWAQVSALVAGSVSLDSRTITGGEVFVALAGQRVDGHAFISQAFERGAAAVFARRDWWSRRRAARARGIHLLVDDSLEALQQWAAGLRERIAPKVVAVTGSSGKSSTKEMILSLLRPLGGVIGTVANRNNEIGLPWTLLQLQAEDRWAVVEMGANHPGEIAKLTRIARPDVAVITCIGHAHEGEFGSADALMAAKLEILEGLSPAGTVVIPDDDPLLAERLSEKWPGAVLRFGFGERAEVRAVRVEVGLRDTELTVANLAGPLRLRCIGPGGVKAALAALAATRVIGAAGTDPRALEAVTPLPGRLDPRSAAGVLWLLDMYNASPESTLANLAFLAKVGVEGRRVFVFGGMRELGASSERLHQEVGRAAGFCDAGVFLGDAARIAAPEAQKAGVKQVIWCAAVSEVVRFLRGYLKRGDVVFLKGARAAGLEAVAQTMGVVSGSYGEWRA